MKRTHSRTGGGGAGSTVYDGGSPLERQRARAPASALLTLPSVEVERPSKVRRHGSRLMAALRSLTNSGKSSGDFFMYDIVNELTRID
jgi:protein-serine/threonine kinase